MNRHGAETTLPAPAFPPGPSSIALSVAFSLIALSVLADLRHDFDEAWLMLDARFILRGLRPYVDFPHHEMPLHLYLLAISGKVFGQTIFGYRMLSLLCVAGSGHLVFRLARSVVGPIPALLAQAAFLFSQLHELSLAAIPETPMIFFLLVALVLLFGDRRRWTGLAAGAAFAVALLVKPTGLPVVAAAVVSLAVDRQWRRIGEVALAGLITSVLGVAMAIYVSDGAFLQTLAFQIERIGTRNVGMWSIDSGFADIRRLNGIETPRQWAIFSMGTFYQPRFRWLPVGVLIAGLLAVPLWVARCVRGQRAWQTFVVLWPLSAFIFNFVVLDFISMRYFLPFPAFAAFLVAGWVWWGQQHVSPLAVEVACAAAIGLLFSHCATTFGAVQDPWYRGRLECVAGLHPQVVSFSPMLFAATGTEPGCGFANPALSYGGFGEAFLTTERSRPLRFDDQRLLECLRAHREIPVMVDWGFYFFNRPGSALRAYLDGEGASQRLFFSPDAVRQWNRPLLEMHPLR